jgi:hypothetical protein
MPGQGADRQSDAFATHHARVRCFVSTARAHQGINQQSPAPQRAEQRVVQGVVITYSGASFMPTIVMLRRRKHDVRKGFWEYAIFPEDIVFLTIRGYGRKKTPVLQQMQL